MSPTLLLTASLMLAAAGPHSPLPMGERLVYQGRIEKAGMWLNVGTATFTITEADDEHLVLRAHAQGEKFGYTLDTSITSVVSRATLRPATYQYLQGGSEQREKRLVFSGNGIEYWKLGHCNDKNCTDPAHQVSRTRFVAGVIPWGARELHCPDRKCSDPRHLLWKLRNQHVVDQPYVDLLTAVYHARTLPFTVGGEPILIPVISDHDRWHVQVRAVSEKRLEVEVGTFDAIELVLEPVSPDGTRLRDDFVGLFGLNGAIRIWIDRESRRPLLVTGILPFAFLNLRATIELVRTESTNVAATLSESAGQASASGAPASGVSATDASAESAGAGSVGTGAAGRPAPAAARAIQGS